MKKSLLAGIALALLGGAAQAADIPVKAPYAAAPGFSWTGFYIGGNVGAGFGTKEFEQTIPFGIIAPVLPTLTADGSHTVNGFLGGGQVGFNYQIGPTVWGVEFEGDGANIRGTSNCGLVALFNCRTKVDSIMTLTGRFGLTYDHTLLYVKGGGAWVHDQYDVNVLGLGVTFPGIILPGVITAQPTSLSEWRSGWVLGTGVEQAIAGGWSAKIEYNYMEFDTKNYVFPVVTSTAVPAINGLLNNFAVTQRMHTIKFGINYRFGGWGYGGVMAAY